MIDVVIAVPVKEQQIAGLQRCLCNRVRIPTELAIGALELDDIRLSWLRQIETTVVRPHY
jgi:phosphoribosylcarboxyaminoimidazole (NCAIR) mutase